MRQFGLCILLLLAWAAVSHGQAIRSPLTLQADSIEGSLDGSVQRASGHATLQSGSLLLQADLITADRKTGEVVASGNLTMTQGTRRLTGEELTYHLDTQCGTVVQAQVCEQGVIIRGARIEFSPLQLVAEKASFSTCVSPEPHYAVVAERITLTASPPAPGQTPTAGRLTLHRGAVWFHGRKRFTLPDYSMTIGDLQQRRAGFMPTGGFGSGDGVFTSWIRQFGSEEGRTSADLNVRLTSRRGVRGFFEVRRPMRAGEVYFDYMRRQNLGDFEPAANQVVGSSTNVLVNREPEVGARTRARPLTDQLMLTAEVTAGRYSEMNTEATQVLARANRVAASAVLWWKPRLLGPRLTVDYALGAHEALYSTGTALTVGYFRGTAAYAWTPENTLALSYINRTSWGESPFEWDSVDVPEELRGDLCLRVNPAWRLRIVERYDLEEGQTRDLLITVIRTAHCLEYTLGWRQQQGNFFVGVNLVPAPPA